MTCTVSRRGVRRVVVSAVLLLTTVGSAGCGLLDVSDPTRLEEQDLANATGVDAMRRNAVRLLFGAAMSGAMAGGILADEFVLYGFANQNLNLVALDLRTADEQWAEQNPGGINSGVNDYAVWQEVRRAATLALRQLRAYAPEPQRAVYVGQMFALRGYAALRLGEDICPGFPLHELDGYAPVYGPPLTTEQVFEHALVDLDSAVINAADSARILNFARVARGRVLLGLGRLAEAASAVKDVPTGYVLNGEYGPGLDGNFQNTGQVENRMSFSNPSGFPFESSVADKEGRNGLDFISAGDRRVQTAEWRAAQGGIPALYRPTKYASNASPMELASGVEARLIEAEAVLQGGGGWLAILNELRRTRIDPPLDSLADPGSAAARLDLLFRERAFWLFGTGHRLGDLRRLVRVYGRSSESVFPTGLAHPATGSFYGTATSLPFPAASERSYSPAVTGCTSR